MQDSKPGIIITTARKRPVPLVRDLRYPELNRLPLSPRFSDRHPRSVSTDPNRPPQSQ